jgi:hypothetical protein
VRKKGIPPFCGRWEFDRLFLGESLTPQLVACLFVHARLLLEAVLPDFGGLY